MVESNQKVCWFKCEQCTEAALKGLAKHSRDLCSYLVGLCCILGGIKLITQSNLNDEKQLSNQHKTFYEVKPFSSLSYSNNLNHIGTHT